jgi:hypothetical protein
MVGMIDSSVETQILNWKLVQFHAKCYIYYNF